MKKLAGFFLLFFWALFFILSSFTKREPTAYISFYKGKVNDFITAQSDLITLIRQKDFLSDDAIEPILQKIKQNRLQLKALDFWLRYFEPIAYKKINGPLPVEWETEVFEKFEAPYKREGGGLTLAELYLEEKNIKADSLIQLIDVSLKASSVFLADSITGHLKTPDHFFLANRLYLLNLAAIYTTGYECPDPKSIIPELRHLMESVKLLYAEFNQNFPSFRLRNNYIGQYEKAIAFVNNQSMDPVQFDHFIFLQNFVNPLFELNQQMILDYKIRSTNYIDYSLNKQASSIFDKSLYRGQNPKGVYIGITDPVQLSEIKEVGKLLFYDPVLSVNNKRSCASCHKPTQFFTDTTVSTNLRLNQKDRLSRNTPSLINAVHNHLLMLDGKHFNLENQARSVITNPDEMGSEENEVLKKILSCNDYKSVFKKYLRATPQYTSVNLEHIASAVMLYYSDFSNCYSSFDHAMNEKKPISNESISGFNLFMSKAKCATCHFVPQFNGVKPPYTGSEFEVIGVPSDHSFTSLSEDKGRYNVHPAKETHSAFRTGSVRNAFFTKPYMHNGVFNTLSEVIDFYDAGGGMGKGLPVSNQTLSPDSLKLTVKEKMDLMTFIRSLDEEIPVQIPPQSLPVSKNKELNNRKVNGEY